MDRNQVIGFVLIAVILIGYSIYTQPTQQEIEAAKQKRDSIAQIQQQMELERLAKEQERKKLAGNTTELTDADSVLTDSAKQDVLINKFGQFHRAAQGEQKFYTIENKHLRVKLTNLGGRIHSVELKQYQTHDSLPLILFEGDNTQFGMQFFADKREIATQNFFFNTENSKDSVVVSDKAETIKFRLYAEDTKYIEYVYSLSPDSYLLNFNINFVGMNKVFDSNMTYIDFDWAIDMPSKEKGVDWENNNSTIHYKLFESDYDNLSETSDEESETLSSRIKWISFKHQFFSSVLIADEYFDNGYVKFQKYDNNPKLLKRCEAKLSIPYNGTDNSGSKMTFFFGPNKYSLLDDLELKPNEDLELESMVFLGSNIIRWTNVYFIVPFFDWLGHLITNYGLLIFVLTILIKLMLFPLTYKSYLSSARMRVLKPQIDEINERIPKDKAMERQQATMALYRKAGVNPMGGCLPMLLQFPILFAMFRFFPSSIELRQQSFLWADDLSTYDSILQLPFTIPMYGDHVSLFTLLMAGAMVISTKMNTSSMDTGSTQLPGMKTMMYMMPVMMVLWFNSYSAGLSYYYFISNVITIIQIWAIRKYFINEEEILAKINARKAKPVKKSKFQQRLDEMAKQQQLQAKKKKK